MPKSRNAGTYFFLNGDLHKKIVVNRGRDVIYAWNYPQHKRFTYGYTNMLQRHEIAMSSLEVAKVIRRSKSRVEHAIWEGKVPTPQMTYSLETGAPGKYMWCQKDVLQLLDYMATITHGRPRKDGLLRESKNLPTPQEVKAIFRDERVLYAKRGENYVPTFRAQQL